MLRSGAAAIAIGVAGVAAGLGAVGGVTGCAGEAPPPKAQAPRGPQWQDVFDGVPEFYAVVRPQAIKRDPVYGAFFKTLLRVAQSFRGVSSVTALEAAQGSDEIVIGVSRREGRSDVAIVLRGVPANLDPAKIADANGRPMLRLLDGRAAAQEYELVDREGEHVSIFVLPDRTWVAALGGFRETARQAFANPFGRPVPKVDADALAAVRLDAATFLPNGEKYPTLGPLVRKLRATTIAIRPGKGGLGVALQYQDEDAGAWGEMQAKRIIEDVAHAEPDTSANRRVPRWFGWLKEAVKTAQVSRENNRVVVRLDLPQRLVDELPNASAADMAL